MENKYDTRCEMREWKGVEKLW